MWGLGFLVFVYQLLDGIGFRGRYPKGVGGLTSSKVYLGYVLLTRFLLVLLNLQTRSLKSPERPVQSQPSIPKYLILIRVLGGVIRACPNLLILSNPKLNPLKPSEPSEGHIHCHPRRCGFEDLGGLSLGPPPCPSKSSQKRVRV